MRILALFLVLFTSCACGAQPVPDIAGNWQGRQSKLKIARTGSGDLRAILHLEATPPDYRTPLIAPASSITFDGSILQISIDDLQVGYSLNYSGKLSADGNTISGTLSYSPGESLPLVLFRVFPTKPITVHGLEILLTQLRGHSDSSVENILRGFQLTQRLDTASLAHLLSSLPGPKSVDALHILAAESTFLDPPSSQIPVLAEPSAATQQAIVARAVDYVTTALHLQPNFYATRITTTYRRNLWKEPTSKEVRRLSSTVVYRNGNEEREAKEKAKVQGITTSGEFGPILGTAMLDAAKGNLIWRRWQEGPVSPFAVFRYVVTANQSHYEVDGMAAGYVGEITIDPSNGAIQRLVFLADMPNDGRLVNANIAVEYGPIELGGRTYTCPMHGLALSDGFALMWLNEISFTRYHLFGTRMRILPAPLIDHH